MTALPGLVGCLLVLLVACGGFRIAADATLPAVALCSAPKPEWIWCDDFEADRSASYFEIADGQSFRREAGVGRNGSWGRRSRFAAGQISAGTMRLAFGRTPSAYMKPVDAGTRDYRDIYWRVFVRHAPGWLGGGGDKLSRLTVFARSDWAQAMIAHVWSGIGPDTNYLLIDPASGTDVAGTLKTSGYNDFPNLRWMGMRRSITPVFDAAHVGTWYCVEAHVTLNTTGQSNGVFELWIDDVLEARRTDLNWLGSYSAFGLNSVMLENYWNKGSPRAQERDFDDFVVSEARIGC